MLITVDITHVDMMLSRRKHFRDPLTAALTRLFKQNVTVDYEQINVGDLLLLTPTALTYDWLHRFDLGLDMKAQQLTMELSE